MRRNSIPCLAALSLALLPSGANAQPPTPSQPAAMLPKEGGLGPISTRPVLNQAISIQEAVETAIKNSPLIKAAAAARKMAAAQLRAARAETQPTLSANTFVSGGSLPNIVESPSLPVARMIMGLPSGGYADQNLMLMYPAFTSGRLVALVRQAEAMQGASQADQEARRQEVALIVRVAYRETQSKQTEVAAAEARLRENEERLRLDRERLAVQRIPAYYVQQGEAQVARARQDVTNAQRDALLSLAQLKTVMGVHLASRLELTESSNYPLLAETVAKIIGTTSSSPSAGPDPVLTALLQRAEQERPEVQSFRLRVEGARRGESAARAGFGPQVNVFVMGDVAKATGSRASGGTTYGLAASLPLWEGGARRARSDEAQATREAEEAQQEQSALKIAQEVNEAYLRAATAEQNVATAEAALAFATQASAAAEARYQAGRSVLAEVLDAAALRTRAQSDVFQARLERSISQDHLRWAVGML